MYLQRREIQKHGSELQRFNSRHGTGLTSSQVIKAKQARNSFVSRTAEIRWVLPKFEKFLPEYWYSSIVLLVLRLLQTSFMALVSSQLLQAVIMMSVTLLAISLQSEFSPYRRKSDNRVALLSQWLILSWVSECSRRPVHSLPTTDAPPRPGVNKCLTRTCRAFRQVFVLMLRIVGVFKRPIAATAIGITLCVATVSVFIAACVLANTDRVKEKRTELSDLHKASIELTTVEPNEETDEKDRGDAILTQGREFPVHEEKVEQPDATGGEGAEAASSRLVATSPKDSNFLLEMLCIDGQTQPDDATVADGLRKENVTLREEIARLRQEKGTAEA